MVMATGSMYSIQFIKSLCHLWFILKSLSLHTLHSQCSLQHNPYLLSQEIKKEENKITKLCSAHPTVWMKSSKQLWLESLLARCLSLSGANLSSSYLSLIPSFLSPVPSQLLSWGSLYGTAWARSYIFIFSRGERNFISIFICWQNLRTVCLGVSIFLSFWDVASTVLLCNMHVAGILGAEMTLL